MPDQLLRAATIDDAPRVAGIVNALFPAWVMSDDGWRHSFRVFPARGRRHIVVAEVDGEPVGFMSAALDVRGSTQEGAAWLRLLVLPEFRRRGIGGALYDAAMAHLGEIGARSVHVWVPDDDDSHRFAVKRGWEQRRTMRYSLAELGDESLLPPMPATPKGVRLVDLDEAGPRAVFEFDESATQDEPTDVPADGQSYDEWMAMHWLTPDHRPDLGVVAISGGRVIAGTYVAVDEATKRSTSAFTGVLREHRGRGLAKLVKSASLRKVAATGITHAYTSNDEENGPMIAVNSWLGYRFLTNQRQYRKIL